jgi:hypothetical protein
MSDAADWTPVTEQRDLGEAVRAVEQHPDVSESYVARSRTVEITLSERVDTVPVGVARIIYRRGLDISDVSPVAGHTRLQITAYGGPEA